MLCTVTGTKLCSFYVLPKLSKSDLRFVGSITPRASCIHQQITVTFHQVRQLSQNNYFANVVETTTMTSILRAHMVDGKDKLKNLYNYQMITFNIICVFAHTPMCVTHCTFSTFQSLVRKCTRILLGWDSV